MTPAMPTRPLLSYYGGKQRQVHNLVPLLPKHTVYCEPYAGGASLFFAKPQPAVTSSDHYREVLNDHDERLITLYRVCQTQRAAFEALVQSTPYGESEYRKAQAILRGDIPAEDLWRAWAYYVSVQQAFNHKLAGGWHRGVYSENHAATWQRGQGRLPAILDRLSQAYLACTDALTFLEQWDSPQTLFYIDPPYVGTHQGHYKGYTAADQAALLAVLDGCQGACLLSGYAQDMPAGWQTFTFAAHCSADAKGRVGADRTRQATAAELGDRARTEYVYYKPRSAPLRPEIVALYATGAYDCFPADGPGTQQLGLWREG